MDFYWTHLNFNKSVVSTADDSTMKRSLAVFVTMTQRMVSARAETSEPLLSRLMRLRGGCRKHLEPSACAFLHQEPSRYPVISIMDVKFSLLHQQRQGRCLVKIPSSSRRWMGSKVGTPNASPGEIYLDNDQTALKNIDLNRLRETVADIRRFVGYETYDVQILLVMDDEIRQRNRETRNVNRPTDILSFPFHFAVEPGVLQLPDFDIPDYYNLGDIMISVPYVIRRCQEDQRNHEQGIDVDDSCHDQDDDTSDLYYGEEEDTRGVSGAMAEIFDAERRLQLLLVHGILHLLGYDHEDDDEYEQMVTKEEEIITHFKLK
jgi:probable rRNA maturation factor